MEKLISKLISNKRILILFGLFLFSILFYYSTIAQGQGRYTVFRTQNEGFKFYKGLSGNTYAPVFGDHPSSSNYHDWWNTSVLNQLTTKYYVLSSELAKIILYPESVSFRRGSNIGQLFLGGRSWIENTERFQRDSYPASLSFEIPTNHYGIVGGFRDLRQLPVSPANFRKIRLEMYTNDSGFCVLSFSPNQVDSRNQEYTNMPMVKIFIIKDVKPKIFINEFANYYYFNERNYNNNDYWYNNFFYDEARYWSINGFAMPLDINLEDIMIPAYKTTYKIMKHSDGSDVTNYDEFNGDWYMIDVELREPTSTPLSLADIFRRSNFRYAYMEGQVRNYERIGGIACKFTVYTDKYLQ